MKTKMNPETKTAVEQYKAAQHALEEEEQALSTLKSKHGELTERIESIASTLEEAKKKKGDVLAAFALGHSDEGALSHVRKETEDLQREYEELKEMLNAVEVAQNRIEADYPPGSLVTKRREIERCKKEAWHTIAEDIKANAPSGMGRYVERLWAATLQLNGGYRSLNLPIGNLIPAETTKLRLADVTKELEEAYLK